MPWLISVVCWLILGTGLVRAFAQPTEEAHRQLHGIWTATRAERDGKAAEDVVGHRLTFTGPRFQIQSMAGKPLYAGTVRVATVGDVRLVSLFSTRVPGGTNDASTFVSPHRSPSGSSPASSPSDAKKRPATTRTPLSARSRRNATTWRSRAPLTVTP